ncbi:flavin dependent monooxygenase-like protein [Plenodomus tracheiphilus IPT5]|uniref:Flavin dependent monooxygenase-like protein n=1 Tax=Plenodomus tracheiphilus IPT5 TaxID=1408161 RepID=A0A6A7B8S8_9PLEO|nr:flavin dependent monooxygenase-like protein [Plenodomus tracheiphilus IPT5]
MSHNALSSQARRIAVVGAGPSGVAAAKYLRAENAFDKIVLFEQRSRSGGIWNYTPDQRNEDLFTIPQANPKGQNQDPEWKESDTVDQAKRKTANGLKKDASFLSPMYEDLETNIPRGLMGFKGLDWPEDTQLFPKHETVLDYVEEYGKEVQGFVQYETQVVDAEPNNNERNSTWNVTTRNLRTEQVTEEIFDAVIVANGHFIVPYIPEIPSIKEWNEQYPGLIIHSKYYRRPTDFTGKKVVVVGNSASGADISNQIAQHCQTPLIWSTRSTSLFSATHGSAEKDPRRKEHRPIKQFLPRTRGVELEGGVIVEDIDAIVFATGYFYSLPFLKNVKPSLITDGSYVNNTYQHLFFAPQPTLSFLALNQRVIPFPVAEAQSAVLARVYSGRLSLPPLPDMQAWEVARKAEIDSARTFHLIPFPKDGEYINMLSRWALSASPRQGLDNDGKGKIPPLWGEWDFWCRENFPAIRRAFGQLGDKRKTVTSIEEVGFDFAAHIRGKQDSGASRVQDVISG